MIYLLVANEADLQNHKQGIAKKASHLLFVLF